MKANVIIEGRGYGIMELEPRVIHGQVFEPEGQSYFCPQCGRLWAQILPLELVTSNLCPVYNRVSVVPCARHHQYLYWPGGSIWLEWERELMAALPPAALRYEVLRHCELVDQHKEQFA